MIVQHRPGSRVDVPGLLLTGAWLGGLAGGFVGAIVGAVTWPPWGAGFGAAVGGYLGVLVGLVCAALVGAVLTPIAAASAASRGRGSPGGELPTPAWLPRASGSRVLRITLATGAGAAALGGAGGLVVGLVSYPPTAPFAAVEVGVPAGALGLLVGAVAGPLIVRARSPRARSPRTRSPRNETRWH